MAEAIANSAPQQPAGSGVRSASERAIAKIWVEVLRLPDVGSEANFFDIGGDSMKAMEVIMRVGEVLGVDLPLMAFFEDPTVAHLASVVDELKGPDTTAALAKIWADVLRLPDVEAGSNFFDIGGDSMKAMEVIVRAGEVFGVELPLMAFFEDPTVAHLAAVVDELREGQAAAAPIVRVEGRREFPLSYSQQMYWLLAQQNRGTGMYNTARIFRVRGELDAATLERSINELRRRQEILQVRIVTRAEGPVQIVDAGAPIRLDVIDLSTLDEDARERAALEVALETCSEPFDLEAGPLLRTRLARLTAEDHLLCLAIHHVVSDGFTGSVLLDELAAIYDAFAAGQPSPLPELELHFTDYAAWESEWMAGERLEGELSYWRGVLAGTPTSLDLPVDGKRSSELDRGGRLVTYKLPTESLRQIQGLAQANGTTLFTILSAGFRILLSRWSGQDDFLIGTLASNRSRSQIKRMVGCFVNSLALRNAIAQSDSVADVIRSETNAVMEAFAHQDCPFAKIVEAVNPERSSDSPLFNVALLLQTFPTIAVTGQHFQAQDINFDAEVAVLDLRLIATESDTGLQIDCEYSTSLFESATIDEIFASYQSVLTQMVEAPQKAVAQIEISESLAQSGAKHRRAKHRETIAIAANFTAEPVVDPLAFWMEQLEIPSQIKFAPFDQVFQQLLNPASLLGSNSDGVNLVFMQWHEGQVPGIQARELANALKSAATRHEAPIVVCVCPPEVTAEEQVLAAELVGVAGVHVIYPQQILDLYPVENYRDTFAQAVGGIPYTPEFFVALASTAARRIYGLRSTPRNVIVLDCDETLWKGSCAEDGPLGVVIDASRKALQEFMLAQQDAGMLLCLAGRNTEADVDAVFAGNHGMLLHREDFIASRIDSKSQVEHLKGLADELGLQLGSFLLIASNPLECADVRANCPDALVLELPADDAKIPDVLRQFWAFDHWSGTLGDIEPLAPRVDLERIATELGGVDEVTRAIQARFVKTDAETTSGQARSATEEILAGIWAGLLRIPPPGIRDDFFRLGGNSLLAVQVLSRVRQALGVEMGLRAMFEEPTLAGLARRIDSARRAKTGVVIPPLVKTEREGPLRASFAQQRLWFLDQLEPDNPIYNIPQMTSLRGPLNLEALRKSLSEIARRHEVLRTTFAALDGQPVQIVNAPAEVPLPVIDLSHLDEKAREQEIARLALETATRPFDLAHGSVMRTQLLSCAPDEHILLNVLHHIAGDRWSAGILAEETEALYAAYATGQPSPLPELPVQYADFSEWQRDWLSGNELEGQAAYWRRQLEGAPALLELPTDRTRPALASHRGSTETAYLPQELMDKLTALSQSEGVTLFMTMLAGLQTLLGAYSGQDDIVVGSPIAGRNHAETEPLIGFFVNTLALRTRLTGNPVFRELLGQVKESTLDAYAHQDIPFERLVEELHPERSLNYHPLFQVLFALQNAPQRPLELVGLTLKRLPLHQGTSTFDMSWFATDVADGMQIRIEYNTDIFDAATIRRALGHYRTMLEAIVSNPERRLSELELLDEAERQHILKGFNDTAASYPSNLCIQDLVTEQAHKAPEAIALVDGGRRVSYRELNARANQLAHALIARGAGPDVPVGICAVRSVDLLVGILGILKSGSPYVPLDPAYPVERLHAILEDAQMPLLVTQKPLQKLLDASSVDTIYLDADHIAIEREPDTDPSSSAGHRHLAYILFTSGSTGRPKGVAIEHRSAAAFVAWAKTVYTPAQLSGVLLSTSVCFDLSIFEIFVTLAAGGKVIIAENALYLPSLEARDEVTLINTVPSAIAELVRSGGVPASVTTVNLAGEALGDELVENIYAHTQVEEVYNLYGPTEDTTYSTFTLVPRGKPVTIGHPIANTQAYVLDPHLHPTPIGVPGELFLGGDGLARGYFGRPDMTAERFVPNPFSSEPNARMYRTGDRCRWLASGDVQYFGRLDQQIKLRGFRIELGEIEATLDRHANVERSIVMVREDEPGMPRLVAYVTLKPSAEVTAEALQQHVRQSLPDFMTPSAIVLMDAFPLTTNGKVDRKVLPAPEHAATRDEYLAPRTETEEQLARIWAEVLRTERVGVANNFFALGGHSLLATQVISRIRRDMNVELPLRSLFESPTVEELAKRIAATGDSAHQESIPRVSRDKPLPLSSAQERLWFLDQLEPESAHYNFPMSMRLTGAVEVEALRAAINGVIQRHEVLRTSFRLQHDRPIQVIADELTIDLPVEDLSSTPVDGREAHARRLVIAEGRRPFQLAKGPLVRALLLRLDEGDHILLLNIHHAATDGWSMAPLVEELGALYEAALAGKPSPLKELPIQYGDYAVWQRQWLESDALQQQLVYWKKQLAGAPARIELPTDRPRPAMQSFRGGVETVFYSKELLQGLKTLGQAEGATLYMTLLAAFQVLLYRYTAQENIVVGTPVANRTLTEVEGLIGVFVNTIAMHTDLSGRPSFRDLLHRVSKVSLDAFANQELPFEELVKAVAPGRDLSANPVVQVLFVLQNARRPVVQQAGVEFKGITIHNETSKLDMGMFLVERPEGLECLVEYAEALFDAATIRRMLGHFGVVLQAIVEDPGRSIDDLPLLTATERREILFDWNATACDYPQDLCVHQMFELQAERVPSSVAVRAGVRSLTYAELNSRANQVASYLRGQGAGPGDLVGIRMTRSVDMVAGLLGILKSGAAYVPLDPNFPAERIEFILEDSAAKLVLTDDDWQRFEALPRENVVSDVKPDDLAYVLHTSGSTGRPKGVQITHRNLVNFLASMQREPGLDESDMLLAVTTLSFDIAGLEIYLPLVTGASVLLASHEDATDGNRLLNLLQQQPTVMQATPATWRMLLDSGWSGSPNLKVLCGGEAFPTDLVAQLIPRCKQLWNMYGPTETTIWSSTYRLQSVPAGTASLGRPIGNTTMYVLDSRMQPVPAGVPGSLFIGGNGVARGYLNRPELTAANFLDDPFVAGARIYRTGDLARFDAEGNLFYLGRTDFQVKVRGFRVELGEIETVVSQHPGVRECVAGVRDERLVAYIIGSPEMPDARELRVWLKQRLPEYMTPTAFVELERFPLTPNGKVDRKALPSPMFAAESEEYTAPHNHYEEVLAGIWAEVLKTDRVSTSENFFELGGHSLSATRVIARARAAFDVELSVRALFEAPTVAGLAQVVEHLERGKGQIEIPPIVPTDRTGALPLSFAQQRLWFLCQMEPHSQLYSMPWAARLKGVVDVEALETALNGVLQRHEILRTTYRMGDDDSPVQVIRPEAKVKLARRDLTALPEEDREVEARRIIEDESARPFDLQNDILFKPLILKLDEQDQVLFVNLHHIACDGWSLGVLASDLAAFYAAALSNEEPTLAALPVQYGDFAVWQRRWLQGDMLEQQLAYWREQLDGAPPVLSLPTDRARPDLPGLRGAMERVTIPKTVSERIGLLSQQHGVTRFMTTLAAFQSLVLAATKQTDIVLGTDLAGRNSVETEGLIGFFVNLIALRTDLSRDPTFSELLGRVRGVTLGAYAHQDLPFDKLVEELRPERMTNRTPIVQVLFVHLTAAQESHAMPGVAVSGFAFDLPSKFDLVVFCGENEKGMTGTWHYNPDLFDRRTILRMAGQFQSVLEQVTQNPELRLSDIQQTLEATAYQQQMEEQAALQQASLQRLKGAKRRRPGVLLEMTDK